MGWLREPAFRSIGSSRLFRSEDGIWSRKGAEEGGFRWDKHLAGHRFWVQTGAANGPIGGQEKDKNPPRLEDGMGGNLGL